MVDDVTGKIFGAGLAYAHFFFLLFRSVVKMFCTLFFYFHSPFIWGIGFIILFTSLLLEFVELSLGLNGYYALRIK